MIDRLLGRLLDRTVGEGGRLPRWLRGFLDETVVWVAIGQLLLALGVRPDSVRRLSVVQAALAEVREAFWRIGCEIPRLEGIETARDLELLEAELDRLATRQFTEEELGLMMPAPLAVHRMREVGAVVLDLLEEVLDRLQILRIRTELIGVDHRAARSSIARLREVLASDVLDDAAEEGYSALARRLEELEVETGPFLVAELETRPVAPRLGEVGRIVRVIRAIPRQTLDRLLPLRLLSSRPVLITVLTKGLEQLRQDWVPPGQRPDPTEATGAARQQDYQRRWRRAHSAFFREVDERDASPGMRRSLIAWTAGLGVLSLVAVGWILLWILGAFGMDLSGIIDRSEGPPPLWPVPTVLVVLAVLPLSYWSAWFTPVDRAELLQPRMHAVADAAPARRARVRAARCGSVVSSMLFFLPFLVLLLIDVKDTFPWEGFGPWRNQDGDLGWWALWAVALPGTASLLGSIVGASRGEARARTLRTALMPDLDPGSGSHSDPDLGSSSGAGTGAGSDPDSGRAPTRF